MTGIATSNWRSNAAPLPAPVSSALPVNLRPENAKPGLVCHYLVGQLPATSIIHQQPWMRSGASNHPVVILSLLEGNKKAVCLQMTSFDGKTLEEKYTNPRGLEIARRIYAPLETSSRAFSSLNCSALVLSLETGFMKEGYVDTAGWFTIETAELFTWAGSKVSFSQQSVAMMRELVRDIITGRQAVWQRQPSQPLTAIHARSWTAEDLGIAQPSSVVNSRLPTPPAESRSPRRGEAKVVVSKETSADEPKPSPPAGRYVVPTLRSRTQPPTPPPSPPRELKVLKRKSLSKDDDGPTEKRSASGQGEKPDGVS